MNHHQAVAIGEGRLQGQDHALLQARFVERGERWLFGELHTEAVAKPADGARRIVDLADYVRHGADEFAAGVASGDVLGSLANALDEGRDLFRQRIDERVRSERDYVEDELQRVAKERAGR